jgi:hypothetical protein
MIPCSKRVWPEDTLRLFPASYTSFINEASLLIGKMTSVTSAISYTHCLEGAWLNGIEAHIPKKENMYMVKTEDDRDDGIDKFQSSWARKA